MIARRRSLRNHHQRKSPAILHPSFTTYISLHNPNQKPSICQDSLTYTFFLVGYWHRWRRFRLSFLLYSERRVSSCSWTISIGTHFCQPLWIFAERPTWTVRTCPSRGPACAWWSLKWSQYHPQWLKNRFHSWRYMHWTLNNAILGCSWIQLRSASDLCYRK